MPAKAKTKSDVKKVDARPPKKKGPDTRMKDVLLQPCRVRLECETLWDAEGSVPTIPVALDKYLIRAKVSADSAATVAVKRGFTPAQVQSQIRLPSMLTDWEKLSPGDTLDSIPLHMRTFAPCGLVRDVAPDPEFEKEFMTTGFIETFQIMLVPVLSTEEETEFLADPPVFLEKMASFEWFEHPTRVYWVCDGATRFTLAKKHGKGVQANFLRPDIPFETASMIANTHNEGTIKGCI